jgi:hypothetical protein
MSFWASSYGFQFQSFMAAEALYSKWSIAGYFHDDCKETHVMFPGLLLSRFNLFDAMLGRVRHDDNRMHRTVA